MEQKTPLERKVTKKNGLRQVFFCIKYVKSIKINSFNKILE